MEVRPVRPEDNKQLIKLSLSAPMLGNVGVCIDRSPDYFAYYNQFGPCHNDISIPDIDTEKDYGWVAACVEDNGEIIGVVATASKPVMYEGRVLRAVFPSDARIAPRYQSKGVLKKLIKYFSKNWISAPADVVIGYIIKGNYRAEKGFKEGASEVVTGVPVGDFHMVQLSMYRPYKNSKIKIERANENDIPEVVDILKAFYSDYHFSPVFNIDSWNRMVERTIGYSMNDFRIVRENGKIQALIGLWDQKQVRKVIATNFPARIKWGIWLAWLLRFFMKSPIPPKVSVPQSSMYIKHIAHRPGKSDLLNGMMRNITNEVRIEGGHNYIWGAFFQSDPLYSIFDNMQITDIRSGQYYSPWNSGWYKTPHEIESKPCFADFSMV